MLSFMSFPTQICKIVSREVCQSKKIVRKNVRIVRCSITYTDHVSWEGVGSGSETDNYDLVVVSSEYESVDDESDLCWVVSDSQHTD